MPFTEDLTEFFDTSDHATAVTYTPSGGSATEINGIFDNNFMEIEDDIAGVESSIPMLTCRTSDVSSAAHGDTIINGAITYNIVGVHPDGTGVTILMLEAQ